MSGAVVKILSTTNERNRVLIVQRDDGCFELVVQRFYRTEMEKGPPVETWARMPSPNNIYQTVEIAEREARANPHLEVV